MSIILKEIKPIKRWKFREKARAPKIFTFRRDKTYFCAKKILSLSTSSKSRPFCLKFQGWPLKRDSGTIGRLIIWSKEGETFKKFEIRTKFFWRNSSLFRCNAKFYLAPHTEGTKVSLHHLEPLRHCVRVCPLLFYLFDQVPSGSKALLGRTVTGKSFQGAELPKSWSRYRRLLGR